MSAFTELALQCERRNWQLAVDGRYPNGRHSEGLLLDTLEVRSRTGVDGTFDLLASVDLDPADLDAAAIAAARALDAKGLIA